jgi:hypothetical protein
VAPSCDKQSFVNHLIEGEKMTSAKLFSVFLSLMVVVCVSASAQDRVRITNASLSSDQSVVRRVTDPTYVPGGSRVYVADINGLPGFENNLVAAFQKKRVRPESEASIQMVNLRSGVVAFAVASYKVDSYNGNKSTAEHLAKNVRQKMERDDKRIK